MIIKILERSGRLDVKKVGSTFLGIGMISMSVGLVATQFGPKAPFWDFMEGMLMGISIVMNLAGLVAFGKARRTASIQNYAGNAV